VSASPAPPDTLADLARWQRVALVVGAIGVAVCLLGLLAPETRPHFFRAWLVAFCLCVGVSLGSMVVVMLQYLTGGDWGFVLRRPLEAATRVLPLATLFYIPVALGMPYLYDWARPDEVAENANLQHKAPYLNVGFALVRAVIYFAIWNGLAYLLNSWSRQQDQKKDPAIVSRCEVLSAPGIMLYVVTITFASIDWLMSLEPEWYSTIYAAMIGMGQVLAGFAFSVAVLALLSGRPPLDQVVAGNDRRDLGSLLLAFVMVWAYLAFSQFLLIWAGNLPEETPWYVYRLQRGWQYVGLALIFFHFALPFALLLSTDVKRARRRLAAVALLVLFMRIVDLLWLVVPAFDHLRETAEPSAFAPLLYAAALVGLGGLWLGVYLWQLGRWPLLPEYKPYGEAAHGAVAQH
jgi:hypothetical protein